MKRFLLLYVGKAPKFNELTPEQIRSVLGIWEQWGQGIGNALVDKGTMIADDVELMDNGEMLEPQQINGYSMVQAESLQNALELAYDHPFLARSDGRYSIVALELMSEIPSAPASPQPAPAQTTPAKPAVPGASPQPPTPSQVVMPQPTEQPAPPREPGELTISHEQPSEEQQPPAAPTLPNPQ